MELHADTQGCALSALSLIEKPDTPLGAVVDVDSDLELCTVLSAAVWVAGRLIDQLTLYSGIDRETIYSTLRTEIAGAFTNRQGENSE